MGNRILYLEGFSGLSGDMTVAALLDLAGGEELMRQALASLGLSGYHLEIGRRSKCGIDAAAFDVILESGPQPLSRDHHQHLQDPASSHTPGRVKSPKTLRFQARPEHPGRITALPRAIDGAREAHRHSQDHVHPRNLTQILELINASAITSHAKELAIRTFRILARAEAAAHGVGIDQVHFHEVGAVDSIVDIVAACVLVDALQVDDVAVSPLHEGTGHVWCQHGVIPVPVPATLNIARTHGLVLQFTDNPGEMVTPTGAALAAAWRTRDRLPSDCRILATGIGSGKKDFKQANILRAILLEDAHAEPGELPGDEVTLLETNLDDCTGEALGFVMGELLARGARDVWYTPIQMKKNRPAHQLSVLCDEADRSQMERLIFRHTTAIGIRRMTLARTILPRRILRVETACGSVRVKEVILDGERFLTPEYEDMKRILQSGDRSWQSLHDEIIQAALAAENY